MTILDDPWTPTMVSPLTFNEVAKRHSWVDLSTMERFLVCGTYPDVIYAEDAFERLTYYVTYRIQKALLASQVQFGVRKSTDYRRVLLHVARHLGEFMTYEALGRALELNRLTVQRYLEALESINLIRRCPTFDGGDPKARKNGFKVYFVDVGLRNALLGDFRPLSTRKPSENKALWENLFFNERARHLVELGRTATLSTWKAKGSTPYDMDFVEVEGSTCRAFTCPFKRTDKLRLKGFQRAYPNVPIYSVSPMDAIRLWLMPETVEPLPSLMDSNESLT